MEAYAETYGLDYGPNLVSIAEEEMVSRGSLFSHRAKEFNDYNIGKFGIDLLQYIALPRPYIEELKHVAEQAMKSEVDLSGEIRRKLESR